MGLTMTDRVFDAPDAPHFTTIGSGPRTLEEMQYILDVKAGVTRLLYTLPYFEFVEIPRFAINLSRVPRGSYNNSGAGRSSERNYKSYNDLTLLRDKIRTPWKSAYPGETLHISWPEDDHGSRKVILNPDNRTAKVRIIRCDLEGCRIRTHRGML